MQYEYYTQKMDMFTDDLSIENRAQLNAMGNLGWELIIVNQHNIAIFKRQLPEPVFISNVSQKDKNNL